VAVFDVFDGKGKWAFAPWMGLGAWLVYAIIFSVVRVIFGIQPVTSGTVAFHGAVMICVGAVTVARPVIRVGGYRKWLEKTRNVDEGHLIPTTEELAESEQEVLDARAVNLVGPALAIAGTLLNGVSGLLPL
jgi:hypothetical protein